MLEYLKEESNYTFTENGALTLKSSGSDCLDLFATVGALRRETDTEILSRFARAYIENADTAMKILFYARDIRGGLGERRVFKVILKWLANNYPESVMKNIDFVSEFGRFDDLLSLFGTQCEGTMFDTIEKQLKSDITALNEGENISLLAKWLPSVNASNPEAVKMAKAIARYLKMNDAAYRKTLTALRKQIKIIENNLREKDYTFDYEKQCSRSLFKYRKAFFRNDGERYNAFLKNVEAGKATLHADNVAPYELVEPYLKDGNSFVGRCFMKDISQEEWMALNATWASLPDFGNDENAIAIVDTSGSMYCDGKPLPAAVALSLGIYFAEHNKGCFKNSFIEFSKCPQLIELKGETFADKLRYLCTFNEIGNTNLEAVFDLILNAAVKHHVPQSELPSKLVIISDMEFDCCVENAGLSNFKNVQIKYAEKGYKLPELVFWNAASRNRQQPVKMDDSGAVLVSGVTPRIFSMVVGKKLSPIEFMLETIGNERYSKIAA